MANEEKDVDAQIAKICDDIQGFLQSASFVKAIQLGISAPTPKQVEGKTDKLASQMATLLTKIASPDGKQLKDGETDPVPKFIEGLSADERAGVLKYVYRGMAVGANCPALLRWHSAIVDKDGHGSIMRVLVSK